jgi:hypothetical protein
MSCIKVKKKIVQKKDIVKENGRWGIDERP